MNARTTLKAAGWGALAVIAAGSSPLTATEINPMRDALLSALTAEAKAADATFSGFSPERGAALFKGTFTSGKPDTPSCTTCHSADPTRPGQTRAGKTIEPMAVSVTPQRFTDGEKVAKWFERNCTSVLGRLCTPTEKGDFLTFMINR